MFQSRAMLHLAKASLKVSNDGKETRKDADVQLIFEPFSEQFAHELGEDIARHLFEGGKICPELESVTLDPRVPKQQVTVSADVHGQVELVKLRHVEFGALTVSKQTDEKSGDEWLKATIRARFDLAPKVHREFLVAHFGAALVFAFEAEQGDMLGDADVTTATQKSVRRFVGAMRKGIGKDGSVTIGEPGKPAVRITQDDIEVFGERPEGEARP